MFICQDALDKVKWLKEFLKCDQWFVYDTLTCKPLVDDCSVPYAMMADCIHHLIKKSTGVVQRYVGRNGKIYKEDVFVCDLQPYHYETYDKAKQSALKWFSGQIKCKQDEVEYAQQSLKMYQDLYEQLKNSSE